MEKLREMSLISRISRSSLEITKLVKQLQSKFAVRVLLRLIKDGDLIFIKCTFYAYCITSISGTLGAMMKGLRYFSIRLYRKALRANLPRTFYGSYLLQRWYLTLFRTPNIIKPRPRNAL